jgi:hypothetical protein
VKKACGARPASFGERLVRALVIELADELVKAALLLKAFMPGGLVVSIFSVRCARGDRFHADGLMKRWWQCPA